MEEVAVREIFQNKRFNRKALVEFGFVRTRGGLLYKKDVIDGQFTLNVKIDSDDKISTEMVEKAFGEKYTLHLIEGAKGDFVGKIRRAYLDTLGEIAAKCCESNVFKDRHARKIIEYIAKKYQNEPEFLWKKFPTVAIFRRKDSAKWIALLSIIDSSKLGAGNGGGTDILNLRISPTELESAIDNEIYFAAYHMNKKHWITIRLDSPVSIRDVYKKIDKSYELAVKR